MYQARPLSPGENFSFSCHPEVTCFTECCRELELTLTPYDVLRLRRYLQLSSADFLARHAVIEHDNESCFPQVYLGMVDDGRASCPFVQKTGCILYADRPGACRTYPVARGVSLCEDSRVSCQYALIQEAHCQGFAVPNIQNVQQWETDQDLNLYNEMNDLLLPLLQHQRVKEGFRLSAGQAERYLLALYRLDEFRRQLQQSSSSKAALGATDEDLLRFAVAWLLKNFFSEE